MLLFASMNACVKQLPHLLALEIIFFRSVYSIVASYVALQRLGVALPTPSGRWPTPAWPGCCSA